ncbi:MAG TPA: vitamin K epoxide reductase family protein [Chthoniobacterales bacterium]
MHSRRIAIIAAAVACFGLIDSGYLTIKHLQGAYIRCDDECSAVLGSKYADGIAGVPLAGFGAAAYLAAILTALMAVRGSSWARKTFPMLATGMALFSVWLVYLQAFVIHAFCKYCLASAATSFVLAGLAFIDRLLPERTAVNKA